MEVEQKRKFFLESLEKRCKKFSKMENYFGPGIKRRLLRFVFAPKTYQFNSILRKIIFFPKKTLQKSRLFWGKEIILDIKDRDGFELNQRGFLWGPEIKLTKFLIKYLKETDIFYDIGANYGFYTSLALEFVKEVHAFEPIPEVFRILKLNFKNNKNVYFNNVALGKIEGEQKFYFVEKGSEGSTLLESALKYLVFPYREIKVRVITLDKYIQNYQFPTFVKIDVEGAERLVIEGGINFFQNFSPTISIEVWSKKRGGELSKEAAEKLRSLGYTSYFIKDNGEIESCFGDLNLKISPDYGFDNFIFKK